MSERVSLAQKTNETRRLAERWENNPPFGGSGARYQPFSTGHTRDISRESYDRLAGGGKPYTNGVDSSNKLTTSAHSYSYQEQSRQLIIAKKMEKEDSDFFGDGDDEVFDENSGLVTEGMQNAEERNEPKKSAAHLPRISEEDNTIHEPSLVNPVYSVQGDFRFDESGDEDNTVGNNGLKTNQESSKATSYFDENLAASSFKFGDAALDLINKDGELLRQTHALRLPSQTFYGSPSGGFGFDQTKADISSRTAYRTVGNSFRGRAEINQTRMDSSQIPLEVSQRKVDSSQFHVEVTKRRMDGSQLQVEVDQKKADTSQFPAEASQRRIDSLGIPVEVSQKRMDASQISMEQCQKKGDSSQFPVEVSQRKAKSTQLPMDRLKVDCSKSVGCVSQKSQSKSEPKQGVVSNIEDRAMPSSFSLPKEGAPTFLLNTSKGSHSPPLLDVDKPCMYFGFRQLNYESMDVLNLNGLVDCGLIIRCRLKPLKNEAFRVLYKADTKQKIRAFGTHSVYISFCPKQAARYRATLHIDCLSQKNESAEYTCQLLGFGGQSMVNPFLNPVSKSRRDLVMSAGGRYVMSPKSINKFSFMLENKGTRDAFASVILQDVNGDEIPTENAFVQPANLLLDKASQGNKRIEVRMFVQNPVGSRGNSFASNASSGISSAVNSITGCALPTAFRILVLWGEERQRQRLKMLERRKREKFYFLNRHFTVTRYEGEQVAWDDATDELLSKEDYRMFEGYLRVTVIEVLDKRYSRYIQQNAFKSRPASATGNTVIELEPDNTNYFGRDSILSSILE